MSEKKGYPTSTPVYPTYPQQSYGAPGPSYPSQYAPQYQNYQPQGPPPNLVGPPPAYDQPTYPTGYCPPPMYAPTYGAYNTNLAQAKVVEFDSGARFKGRGSGSIVVPPPPPGYLPNAAQVAAMSGQPVQMKKKKRNFFTGH